jgi:uncharacterized integral membrane protein (TIGR00698 family)
VSAPPSPASAHVDAPRLDWRARAHGGLAKLGALLPGVGLAALLGALATALAAWVGEDLLGYAKSPISAIPLTVLLGLVVRDVVGVPGIYEPGLRWCVKRLLRIGVVLLGIRLSLLDAGATGLVALPVVLVCIAVALLLVRALARALALPERLGTLVAVGTSICGVTAIVATAPVIDATEDEASYAVATIALFGTIALFVYPFLAHLLFGDARQVGLFLGTAIHDTSQVAGAGLTYQQQFGAPQALNVAMVTKLVRNSCMVAVIPLVRALHRRGDAAEASASGLARVSEIVPLFILGFVGMAALRTVGDAGSRPFGVLEPAAWGRFVALAQTVAELALLLAMAAVGLSTSLRRLRVLGLRPLVVGMAAALCVGAVSATLIHLLAALALL